MSQFDDLRGTETPGFEPIVRILEFGEHAVELRGGAAEMWLHFLTPNAPARERTFLDDVACWALLALTAPDTLQSEKIEEIDGERVFCAWHDSATLLYVVRGKIVVVFWLPGLLRPFPSSAGSNPAVH